MIDDDFRVEVPDTNVANRGDMSNGNPMDIDPIEAPPEVRELLCSIKHGGG